VAFISVILGSAQVYATESITIRSGNGQVGTQDMLVTMLAGPQNSAFDYSFTPADFNKASTGLKANIVNPEPSWKSNLTSDPLAKWISKISGDQSDDGFTALYAIDFTITSDSIESATLDFDFLVDNELGDTLNEGLYINGMPVSGSKNQLFDAANFQIDQSFPIFDITSLVKPGTNTVYINAFDRGGPSGLIFSGKINVESSQTPAIPDWIRNNAKWWAEGAIADSDFISGIEYLIKENIISIPDLPVHTSEIVNEQVPEWVKNNAAWWADELISDTEFVSGIKYLVEHGIIKV